MKALANSADLEQSGLGLQCLLCLSTVMCLSIGTPKTN